MMEDEEAVDIQGMNAPVAGACVRRGCHYAGFLEQTTGYTNTRAEVAKLRAALEEIADIDSPPLGRYGIIARAALNKETK